MCMTRLLTCIDVHFIERRNHAQDLFIIDIDQGEFIIIRHVVQILTGERYSPFVYQVVIEYI